MFEDRPKPRIGVWLAGARGDIATTLMVGSAALANAERSTAGMTTARPPFDRLPLAPLSAIRFGGADVRDHSLVSAAESLYRRSRTIDRELLDAVTPWLEEIEPDILNRPDFTWDPGVPRAGLPCLGEIVEAVRADIRDFRDGRALERVLVVNLTSAQPLPAPSPLRDTLAGVDEIIRTDRKDLITSSVCYAYAALAEGCPYVNFTPNEGTRWGGIAELAALRRVPFCGDDGKTGETLVKTALAHMFAFRNLEVMSWEGVNLLGNSDGRTLHEDRNKEGKIRNKGGVLANILGYEPHAGVTINFVPSLGDWKTAWDLIHFRGFLDVPMSMQFTWQGCDSILAAPLVLDLVRLTDFAARRGQWGPLRHLAAFFKMPLGVDEMDFHRQFGMLLDYAERELAKPDPGGG